MVITRLQKPGQIYRLKSSLGSEELRSEGDAETILRMAIGFLHQQARKRVPLESVQVLPRSAPAWPGDWCWLNTQDEAAAGEMQPLHERRKGNVTVERCIGHGLALLEKVGRVSARAYLKDARIAATTIRRVLFTKRIRARTRTPEEA